MTVLSGKLSEAYAAWLDSISSCYATITPCFNHRRQTSRQLREKADFVIYRDQPGFTPPPCLGPLTGAAARDEALGSRPRSVRRTRRSFSVTKRLWPRGTSSSRRPKISAPSNFRHIQSESFQFPPSARPARRPRSFRPLELSIYVDNNLSPILPHFVTEQDAVLPPMPARTHGSFDSTSSTLTHERSDSSMSFHLPRRPIRRSSSAQDLDDPVTPPRIPPRSRMRAYTSPERIDRMLERVASAMLEKEKLQADIDSIIERQSIYLGSRPSTAHGLGDLEPMPSIPALPAAGPSFAERLSIERPRTAPPKALAKGSGVGSPVYEAPDIFDLSQLPTQSRYVPQPAERMPERPLAPPLPLVLRPPLRKKKSFSRVSNWLFPAGGVEQHPRDMSFDSVTNAPRPVTDKEGFYTCMAPARRGSFDTLSSSYSWDTQAEERTQPTTLSVTDSPVGKQDTPSGTPLMNRTSTFGRSANNARHRPQSVGVAY